MPTILPLAFLPARAFVAGAAALGLTVFSFAPTQAATLAVDWGGNYVTNADGSQPLQPGGFTGGGDPLQTSPASNYSGPTFYGKMEVFSGSSNMANYRIVNNGDNDRIELKTQDAINNTGFLVLFRQENFLNGLNTGNIGFDSTTSIRLNNATYANQTDDSGRLVLRLGSDYYISERIYTVAGDLTTTDLTALDYFAYNPASGATPTIDPNNPTTPVAIVTGGQIQNVTEVGFYFEAEDNANAIRIQDFEVNMIQIPEPAAVSLLAALIPLAMLRRRR